MIPVFGQTTVPLRGFARINRADVGLVFQTILNASNKKILMITIVKDNGQHVSSYPITRKQYQDIVNRDFWVIPTQPFN